MHPACVRNARGANTVGRLFARPRAAPSKAGIILRMLEKSGSPSAPPPHEGEGETEFVGSGNVRVSLTHREIVAIYLCLLPGFFIGALNQTIVATALPTIGAELRDAENLAWVVLSYLITATVVSPLFGKLADIYGRHTMLVAALAVFLVGSIACALAPSMLFLVLARALQGIGAGGIMPVTQTLIADIVTPRQRGRYQSYTSLVWVIGGFLGPVLGSITERWHWSLVFWVNVPVAILAIALVSTRLGKVPQVRRKHTLDPLGGMLLVTAAVLVMLILTWGGTRFPWISTDMAMLTAATLAFLVAFASRMLTAEHPVPADHHDGEFRRALFVADGGLPPWARSWGCRFICRFIFRPCMGFPPPCPALRCRP